MTETVPPRRVRAVDRVANSTRPTRSHCCPATPGTVVRVSILVSTPDPTAPSAPPAPARRRLIAYLADAMIAWAATVLAPPTARLALTVVVFGVVRVLSDLSGVASPGRVLASVLAPPPSRRLRALWRTTGDTLPLLLWALAAATSGLLVAGALAAAVSFVLADVVLGARGLPGSERGWVWHDHWVGRPTVLATRPNRVAVAGSTVLLLLAALLSALPR